MFSAARFVYLSVRNVPIAGVNLRILNVGFGDAGYQVVAESEAAYIKRGGAERG